MPPAGAASACSSSATLSTRQCGVRVAAQRLARSTPCGVPKSRSNRSACSGAPCSSEAALAARERREERWSAAMDAVLGQLDGAKRESLLAALPALQALAARLGGR